MEYNDFQLELGATGEKGVYSVRVESPYRDTVEDTFRLPYDETQLERVLRDIELAVLKGTGRRRTLVAEQAKHVTSFGDAMFDAIFDDEVGDSYRDAVRRSAEEEKGLRVRLTTKTAELSSLPWELLRDTRRDDWLVLSTSTPLVRHARSHGGEAKLAVEFPLRVLGMVASPADLGQLDVVNEKERMARALAPLIESGAVQLEWTDGGTWRDLQNAMRRGPWHALHFIGHGGFDRTAGQSVLAFESEGMDSFDRISPEQLGRLIEKARSLRLVVLNACEGAKGDEQDALSSAGAYLVRNSAPAVLAMQWEISDESALEFSRTFYTAVAEGSAVDAAVADARVAISMTKDSLEWATPVLFMRSEDGILFDVEAAQLAAAAHQDAQSGEPQVGAPPTGDATATSAAPPAPVEPSAAPPAPVAPIAPAPPAQAVGFVAPSSAPKRSTALLIGAGAAGLFLLLIVAGAIGALVASGTQTLTAPQGFASVEVPEGWETRTVNGLAVGAPDVDAFLNDFTAPGAAIVVEETTGANLASLVTSLGQSMAGCAFSVPQPADPSIGVGFTISASACNGVAVDLSTTAVAHPSRAGLAMVLLVQGGDQLDSSKVADLTRTVAWS